jgi:hypothetical protein
MTAVMRLAEDKDPYLQDVWRTCFEQLKSSFSQEECVVFLEQSAGISISG